MHPPAPAAICFDLDGTLVDSLRDIAEACNHCLDLLGIPTRPMDDFRHLVGEGIPKLAERAVATTHPWLVARLAELTRARYRVQPCVHTRPYAGIAELIDALVLRGIPLGVLSNKPHELTVPIVDRFWSQGVFQFVQGYDFEERRKPSPFHVLRFCDAVGQPPDRVWLIGDTPTDIETARRAGATCIAVTWGFRPPAELRAAGALNVVDSPEEILHLCLKRAAL